MFDEPDVANLSGKLLDAHEKIVQNVVVGWVQGCYISPNVILCFYQQAYMDMKQEMKQQHMEYEKKLWIEHQQEIQTLEVSRSSFGKSQTADPSEHDF